jgi:hypothetical protein
MFIPESTIGDAQGITMRLEQFTWKEVALGGVQEFPWSFSTANWEGSKYYVFAEVDWPLRDSAQAAALLAGRKPEEDNVPPVCGYPSYHVEYKANGSDEWVQSPWMVASETKYDDSDYEFTGTLMFCDADTVTT